MRHFPVMSFGTAGATFLIEKLKAPVVRMARHRSDHRPQASNSCKLIAWKDLEDHPQPPRGFPLARQSLPRKDKPPSAAACLIICQGPGTVRRRARPAMTAAAKLKRCWRRMSLRKLAVCPRPVHREPLYVRPRMACTCCDRFHQAPLPSGPIERGRPARASSLMSSIFQVLPTTCHSTARARSMPVTASTLERSTMADWFGQVAALLGSAGRGDRAALCAAGAAIHADDTPVQALLAPGNGKTKNRPGLASICAR